MNKCHMSHIFPALFFSMMVVLMDYLYLLLLGSGTIPSEHGGLTRAHTSEDSDFPFAMGSHESPAHPQQAQTCTGKLLRLEQAFATCQLCGSVLGHMPTLPPPTPDTHCADSCVDHSLISLPCRCCWSCSSTVGDSFLCPWLGCHTVGHLCILLRPLCAQLQPGPFFSLGISACPVGLLLQHLNYESSATCPG